MMEEKRKVLAMVQEGKISVDEGLKLLAALETSGEDVRPQGAGRGRALRVRVYDAKDNAKANICIPLSLAKVAMKLIPKDVAAQLKQDEVDLDEILASITRETIGKIADIETADSKVEVYVE